MGMGNLWFNASSFQLLDPQTQKLDLQLHYTTGAGVRYETPIGPFALDVGVNLTPDMLLNEPNWVVHFSIGVF